MTENEKVRRIQFSPKEKGEPELIEEIIQGYTSLINALAYTEAIRNCHLEPEDVKQFLRLRLFRAIEKWPRQGSFRAYATTTLRNTRKTLIREAHAFKGKIVHETVSLESLEIITDPFPRIDEKVTAEKTLDKLESELKAQGFRKLAEAITLLRRGNDEEYVASLFDYSNAEEMFEKIRYWSQRIAKQKGWIL